MAIRKIARLGHPVLRAPGREMTPDEIRSPATARLVEDMIETLREYSGIGLAAPQIHESLSLAIIEEDEEMLAVFNPKVTVLDEKRQGFWEGCLSVPGMRGLVYRPRKIQVDYLDSKAKPQTIVAEDFLATVFQHELDHLQGVLYVDRVENIPGRTALAFQEEYERYLVPREDSEIQELAD